ncbi:MAG TPA: glycoside hydrolase family 76 protein [Thermomicrobiales bacterium]|nr:glycoside hydrolase family 76 protein [Thermomicrobiales bacterium]
MRGAIRRGRWLLPVLVCLLALSGLPAGPLQDDDRASLYRSGADVPLPDPIVPEPTATPTAERALLNIEGPTVTPQPAPPTPAATATPEAAAVSVPEADRIRARKRAIAIYSSLWEQFYLPDDRLFRETAPYDTGYPYAYLWPLSQTLGVATEMAALPEADPQYTFDALSVASAIESYFDDDRQPPAYSSYIPPPYGHANDRFYDDNAWIGIELMRAYDVTGYELAIERAGQIFDYLVSGWDASESGPTSGGVYWVEASWSQHRNTVSTAPAAMLGLLLAAQEDDAGRRHYELEWSKRMYDWVDATLRDPGGLYWDHIDENGVIDEAIYTYNQGAMLGASLLLYQATNDERYLDRADEIGRAVIRRWDVDGLLAQPIAFNAILLANLLTLNDARPNQAYIDLFVAYADRLWDEQRDPDTNLVTASVPADLLNQSAAARIYAMLAGYGS